MGTPNMKRAPVDGMGSTRASRPLLMGAEGREKGQGVKSSRCLFGSLNGMRFFTRVTSAVNCLGVSFV